MRISPWFLLPLAACSSASTTTAPLETPATGSDAAVAAPLDARAPLDATQPPPDVFVRDALVPDAARPNATNLHLPITHEPHVDEAPYFNVTRPSDLAQPGGLLPVVVWANGGCLRSDFTWAPLFDRWAGAGYVVLSLTGTSSDQGLEGLLSMLDTTSETEHRALIDWVVNAAGPYAGKLDLKRIVLAGNSCGGVTALESAAHDERAAAVFVLSGSSAIGSVDEQIMKAITMPVGYVIGGADDIAGANARGDYAAMNEGVPAMIVNRREGDHITVSTDEAVLPQDAELALSWMELALYGSHAAYDALTSANVCAVCTPGDWTLTAKNLETLRE